MGGAGGRGHMNGRGCPAVARRALTVAHVALAVICGHAAPPTLLGGEGWHGRHLCWGLDQHRGPGGAAGVLQGVRRWGGDQVWDKAFFYTRLFQAGYQHTI